MRKQKLYRDNRNREKYIVGRFIKAAQVLCIDNENQNRGILPIREALSLADSYGLDLVQISNSKDNVPTCKIIDYSKYKYEVSKKEKLAKKKQRENTVKTKEIKFRPSTDENDLRTKAKQAQGFIDDGNKLKVTVMFRGREMAHKDIGRDTMDKFIGMLEGAVIDNPPSMIGRNFTVIVVKGARNVA